MQGATLSPPARAPAQVGAPETARKTEERQREREWLQRANRSLAEFAAAGGPGGRLLVALKEHVATYPEQPLVELARAEQKGQISYLVLWKILGGDKWTRHNPPIAGGSAAGSGLQALVRGRSKAALVKHLLVDRVGLTAKDVRRVVFYRVRATGEPHVVFDLDGVDGS